MYHPAHSHTLPVSNLHFTHVFILCSQSKHLQHLLEEQQMEVFPSNPSSGLHHTSIYLFSAVYRHLCYSSWLLSAVSLSVNVCTVCEGISWLRQQLRWLVSHVAYLGRFKEVKVLNTIVCDGFQRKAVFC